MAFVARGLASAGLRSGPKTCIPVLSGAPRCLVWRLLRSRTGASPPPQEQEQEQEQDQKIAAFGSSYRGCDHVLALALG
jgi:hypothetical protein